MGEELYLKLKEFYENSSLAQKMVQPLKEGAVAEVEFECDDNTYHLIKEKGKGWLRQGKPVNPQIYLKFTQGAVDYLLELAYQNVEDIQEFIKRFAECVFQPTKERKITFKLCTNIMTSAKMGYLGMMRLGGKKAMEFVLKLGIKIPKRFLDERI